MGKSRLETSHHRNSESKYSLVNCTDPQTKQDVVVKKNSQSLKGQSLKLEAYSKACNPDTSQVVVAIVASLLAPPP